MSKNKGNVYYPNVLIKKGYKGEHMRFFFDYQNYRKRLNFTFKKLQKASRKLDSLGTMVGNLQRGIDKIK
jgi:cysteinyl-tRNA synthetase